MLSKIKIETNYSGFKTSTRTIRRVVKFDSKGNPYCKVDGEVLSLEPDEFNGKPNGEYLARRKVDY
ncbi:MAG: hypothetical protein ACSHWR_08630 [Psychromonas sp.]